MNEIVKYNNSINQTALNGLKAGGIDLFVLLCARARDKGTELLTFRYPEIKKAVGLSDQSNDYAALQFGRACDIINTLRFKIYNELTGACRMVTLFPTCDNDPVNEMVTIRVNPDAICLLNDISANYTKFELQELVGLESKYSKNLYRLLKQWRTSGKYKVDAEELRKIMCCSPKYTNGEFIRKCINPAVKELSKCFKGLTVEPIRGSGRGRPIKEYRFTFQKQTDKKQDAPAKKEKPLSKSKNRFNNFSGRNYTEQDYDELERLLLSSQK